MTPMFMHHTMNRGGDPERTLAAIQAGRATWAKLARMGEPVVDVTLARGANPARCSAGR
jgi:hypothetical protein